MNRHTKPYSLTFSGLALALLVPVIYTLVAETALFSDQTGPGLEITVGLGVMWLITAGLIVLILRGEKRPLSSIGWERPTVKLALMGVGLGVLLSLAVPALSVLSSMMIPTDEAGSIESVVQISGFIMLAGVITAGITEEILYRGYALERLYELTGSKWISSIISLVFFTVLHISGWNLAHIVGVVIPLGAAMIALYWWKRNVILVIIVHIVINLPLVFLAFSGGAG